MLLKLADTVVNDRTAPQAWKGRCGGHPMEKSKWKYKVPFGSLNTIQIPSVLLPESPSSPALRQERAGVERNDAELDPKEGLGGLRSALAGSPRRSVPSC